MPSSGHPAAYSTYSAYLENNVTCIPLTAQGHGCFASHGAPHDQGARPLFIISFNKSCRSSWKRAVHAGQTETADLTNASGQLPSCMTRLNDRQNLPYATTLKGKESSALHQRGHHQVRAKWQFALKNSTCTPLPTDG